MEGDSVVPLSQFMYRSDALLILSYYLQVA